MVTLSELVIGVLLILGLFTGLAAFAGLTLNLVYMFTGSAGVNPAYAIVAVFLILAWRNAGYLGLDGFALPMARERLHRRHPVTGITAPPLPGKSQSADAWALHRLKSAQEGIEAGPEALVSVG